MFERDLELARVLGEEEWGRGELRVTERRSHCDREGLLGAVGVIRDDLAEMCIRDST